MVRREPPKVCSPPLADIQRETSPAVAVPGGRVIRLDRVSVRYGRGAHAIAAAEDPRRIAADWQERLEKFQQMRQKYLIYK